MMGAILQPQPILQSHRFASVFENYYILPRKLRVALDEWHFQEYVKLHDHFKTVKEATRL